MSSGAKSVRSSASQWKVMDQATRRRRARKALESLEQDNFHDDPHADLVMSKKALSLFQDGAVVAGDASSSSKPSSKRKSRTAEYYKQRFRKNFAQLLEEDSTLNERNSADADKLAQQQKANGCGDKKKKVNKETKHKSAAAKANYFTAQAPHSSRPQRHFCAVCGFASAYTCVVCGVRYCSLPCQETHRDTRCMKYTA